MLARVVTDIADPVPIPNERSAMRRVWDHLRSVLTRLPYTTYEYRSHDFRRQLLERMRRGPPQLVHLDSFDLQGWVDDLPDVPVACTHIDIEPMLLRLRATRMPGVLRRYVHHQADLMQRLMHRECPRFDLNVMMSELDAERLQTIAPGSTTHVAPNGVDTEYFRPMHEMSPISGRIVFLGPTYQFANRDAVEYLIEEILPRVRNLFPTPSLRLIGWNADADRKRWEGEPGVTCAGQVEDIRPLLAEASCVVVPIRIGGGTRLKILDAWAMGKAVVSTAVGCEGLRAADGENILIRDTPHAFADAVCAVLGDPALRQRLGSNGRETVSASYAWPRVGQHLRAAYLGLLGV
jgi:glycosyltransferase involved in cell wall biosynthesis